MALSRANTSAKAANPAKVRILQLNKCRVKQRVKWGRVVLIPPILVSPLAGCDSILDPHLILP